MKPEDKSKIQSLASDLNGLKSRSPEETKFKDWKDKAERNLEEVFGKSADQLARFKSIKFFEFGKRQGVPKETPLNEGERARFISGLEEARRLLSRFTES